MHPEQIFIGLGRGHRPGQGLLHLLQSLSAGPVFGHGEGRHHGVRGDEDVAARSVFLQCGLKEADRKVCVSLVEGIGGSGISRRAERVTFGKVHGRVAQGQDFRPRLASLFLNGHLAFQRFLADLSLDPAGASLLSGLQDHGLLVFAGLPDDGHLLLVGGRPPDFLVGLLHGQFGFVPGPDRDLGLGQLGLGCRKGWAVPADPRQSEQGDEEDQTQDHDTHE